MSLVAMQLGPEVAPPACHARNMLAPRTKTSRTDVWLFIHQICAGKFEVHTTN